MLDKYIFFKHLSENKANNAENLFSCYLKKKKRKVPIRKVC